MRLNAICRTGLVVLAWVLSGCTTLMIDRTYTAKSQDSRAISDPALHGDRLAHLASRAHAAGGEFALPHPRRSGGDLSTGG